MSGRAIQGIRQDQAMHDILQNPIKLVENARKGSVRDLMDVANLWPNNGPALLKLGVVDVFLMHLDGKLIPAQGSGFRNRQTYLKGNPAVDKAYLSLAGISKLGTFLYEPARAEGADIGKIEKSIMARWDDIYKWLSFFYSTRIAPVQVGAGRQSSPSVPPELQRTALEIIAGTMYSMSRSEKLRRAIVNTEGSIEMATRMWILEDECPVPTSQEIPVCTANLDGLLRVPDFNDMAKLKKAQETEEEKEERAEAEAVVQRIAVNGMLDRVCQTANNSPPQVVQLLLARIKRITSTPQIATAYSAINLDLMGHLSRSPDHVLRGGFMSEGATKMCTKLAVTICGMLDKTLGAGSRQRRLGFGGIASRTPDPSSRDENLLAAMVSALGFLANTLETTDGFSWVNTAVNAGLLTAWIGAAKYMKYMHPEDADMVLMLLREILPRYLVYRSVVLNVKTQAMRLRDIKAEAKKNKPKTSQGKANWDLGKRKGEGDELDMVEWWPVARKVWTRFEKLALERYIVSMHMKLVKGKAVTCDNVECQKTDTKNNFRKCGECKTSLYCSRECQTVAWKKGGHKNVCRMKQTEIAEGKYEHISKPDADYFHHLSTRDARHNMPLLRRMAKASYPDLPPTALVICIDYMDYPTKFAVHPLSEHEKHSPRISSEASSNAEARNDELINRARENPGKFGIVQSKIPNGQGMQYVLSVVPGMFWDDAGWVVEEDEKMNYRADQDDEDEEDQEQFLARMKEMGEDGMDIEDAKQFSGQQVDTVDEMMARMALNRIIQRIEGGR